VHQRVDILQAFLVNDTRRKIYCKNTLRSQRVKQWELSVYCPLFLSARSSWKGVCSRRL